MEMFSNSESVFFLNLMKKQLRNSLGEAMGISPVRMSENSKGYSIELPVEDGKKEDFSMYLDGDVLVVSQINSWGNDLVNGAGFQSYIAVPNEADVHQLSIDCVAGQLKISMPRKEEVL